MTELAAKRNNTLKQSSRIDAIDVAKGIGMIFVIFAHVNYTPAPLTVIYSFHMPLFFILSGIMFQREKYSNFGIFLKRRLKSLIIPYLIFQAISVAFFFVSELIFSGISSEMLNEGAGYILQIFISQGSAGMFNRPMWFVLCLLTVEVIYYFISSLGKISVAAICAVLTTAGWLLESGLLPFDNSTLPWSLDSALFALGFYALGNLLSAQTKGAITKVKSSKYRIPICIGMALLYLAVGIPLALLNGKVSLGSKILNNGFLFYLTGILGTVFILALSIILEKSKLLRYCGKVSFYIMAIHYLMRMILSKVYLLFGLEAYNSTVLKECIIPVIIITAVSILSAFIYDTVTKRISGLLQKIKR